MQVVKADHAQQIVYGWAGQYTDAEGNPVVDLQGDVISPEEIEKASYAYLLDKRDNGVMHEGKTVGKIVASLVTTPDVVEAFFPESAGKMPVGWIIGVKYPDKQIFKAVVEGKLAMFSIQGNAEKEEIGDEDLQASRALGKLAKFIVKVLEKGGHGSGRTPGSNPGSGRKPGVKKPGLVQKPSGNHRRVLHKGLPAIPTFKAWSDEAREAAAAERSKAAHEASKTAAHSGKKEDHLKAQAAHQQAADLHQAMHNYSFARRESTMADQHARAARRARR